ncbi:DUF2391 family protein [Candidatus Woesearchaeota archaeon]|nr:DUF2391 family protein [Candidatus Woesearchaeota archaeon]
MSKKDQKVKTLRKIIRVDGKLREIVTVLDSKGKILQQIINPVMLEFYPRDLVQVIIGASILAVPVAFTEETWRLGESLQILNIILIMFLSLIFISLFVYYNYYRNKFKDNSKEFFKRILSTYLMSFLVVSIILFLIGKAPWGTNNLLALKRAVLVAFPASMSAAIADMVK